MVLSPQPQSVVHTLSQGTVGGNSRSRRDSVSRGNKVREEKRVLQSLSRVSGSGWRSRRVTRYSPKQVTCPLYPAHEELLKISGSNPWTDQLGWPGLFIPWCTLRPWGWGWNILQWSDEWRGGEHMINESCTFNCFQVRITRQTN